MATDKPMTGSFWNDMLQWGLYKKTQGKITRQVTLSAVDPVCHGRLAT